MRRDPVVMSAMDRRERGIVRQWHVEPPRQSKQDIDKRVAGICEDGLSRIHRFNAARRRLAEAGFVGRTYGYIEGEYQTISLDGGPEMEWWIPLRIRDIDRRRFHWVAETKGQGDNLKREVWLEMYNDVTNHWVKVTPEFRQALIEYTFGDTEDRVGYGRGLLEATYFYHYMKTVTLEKISQGVDRWANGIIKGKLNSLRSASPGKTNEDLKNGMKSLLRNMRSEHIVVMQEGDEIEVLETTGQGHNIGMDFIKYLDEAIERLYNGSTMPAGFANEGGSKARAETEADTSESFYQPDREDLDDVLSRDLLGLFWKLNRRNFLLQGLGTAKRPVFTSRQERKEDPAVAATIMGSALDRGLPILKKEYYERLGLSIPALDDEVVTGRSLAASNPFAPSGGGGPFGGNGNDKGNGGEGTAEEEDPNQDAEDVPEMSKGGKRAAFARMEEKEEREPVNITVSPVIQLPSDLKLEIPVPVVNVNVPEQPTPTVTVNVPDQPTPVVNVSQPQIDVHVPAQAAPVVNVKSPDVTVNVPKQERPEINVEAPKQKAKDIDIKRDASGKITGATVTPKG